MILLLGKTNSYDSSRNNKNQGTSTTNKKVCSNEQIADGIEEAAVLG